MSIDLGYIKGPKGDKGDAGPRGIQGPQGIQGIKGEKGDQGEPFTIAKIYESVAAMNAGYANDGIAIGKFVMINTGSIEDPETGRLYCKGDTAYQFIVDLSGATGIQGPKGDKGEQGIQGPQGTQGPQGEKGDKGDTGATGAAAGFGTPVISVDSNVGTPSATVTASGPATAKIFTFSFKNLKGNKGDTGARGPQGETGEQGPQGETGATPVISMSASVDANVGTPSVTVSKSGTTESPNYAFAFKNIKGATGSRGPQGPQGDTGPQGPQGKIGPQGEKGETGATPVISMSASVDANVGTPSVTVSKSGTTENPNYAFAFKNIKGATGATGPQGAKGDTGPIGPQGEKGLQGEKGDTGAKGATGVSMRIKGAWSSNSISYVNNTTYIDIVTYNGSTYGCRTSHTSSTSITPTNTTYWTLLASKGNTGATGPKGETGPRGPQGEKGDKGDRGLTPIFTIGEDGCLYVDYEEDIEPSIEVITRAKEKAIFTE